MSLKITGAQKQRSAGLVPQPEEMKKLGIASVVALVFGFLIGTSVPMIKFNSPYSQLLASIDVSEIEDGDSARTAKTLLDYARTSRFQEERGHHVNDTFQIYVPSNPYGAETLPPGIIVPESDFYLRRLWGKPSEDVPIKQKYLVTFTVGYKQKANIDAAVKKFSGNFTILLFHYDGRASEWDEFEWSKSAIHVACKRFLHPDVVVPYDYIFIWDEDLGVEHFDAERYIDVIKRHGLEISQPGVDAKSRLYWHMPRKRNEGETHLRIQEPQCRGSNLPPCAAFVEVMAPVFSRDAWRCVWHMIQNDLVHGWGLDLFGFRRCVYPAHEKIGVVDSQWIAHLSILSLLEQGKPATGENARKAVYSRSGKEMGIFNSRIINAEKTYFAAVSSTKTNQSTTN